MQLITASRLRAFRSCRRLHHYRYELLRRPIVSARPLGVGTLAHVGLEAWWRWFLPVEAGGKRHPTPLDAALAATSERVAENRRDDGEVSAFDVASIGAMMIGYDGRWFEDAAENYEVLGVEVPFVCELVNPDTNRPSTNYRQAGKLDVVVRRRRDRRLGIVEHKTTGSSIAPESSYWPKLRMDGQVSMYVAGARAVGFDAEFVLYDVLSKPGLKPFLATPEEKRKYRKADGKLYENQRERDETVDEFHARILEDIRADPNGYFARAEIVRLDSELREFAWDTWQTTKSLHETRLAGRHARNPEACFAFGRACDYFDVCTGAATIDDDFIFRTAADAHEELSGEAAGLAAIAAWTKDRDAA